MLNKQVRRNLVIALILITVFIIGYLILPVSIPLIIALVTALLLEPIIKLLQNKANISRNLSVFFVFTLFLVFIGVSGYFVTTKVVTEVIKIVENAPTYINEISRAWEKFEKNLYNIAQDLPQEFVDVVTIEVESFFSNLKEDVTSSLTIDNVKNIFTNIPNFLVSLIVYLIALFLFLLDLPRLRGRVNAHLTEKTADKVNFMSSRLSYVIFGFFKAQFLVSIIIFLVSLVGLLFITPNIALVMALIIWAIDFIPIIGSIVILGPWALFHLFAGDVVLGTKLAILAIALLIIRRTVEPKVMGSHIGLSPLSTLIAMYLGLKLLGILGFILGPLLLIAFNSAREAGIIKLNFKL
ncbi:sporulation integral membrane protein YtvI [Bacillus sp. SM2101]|uniref:sporulation integral membrane protein YtvI n=1 Tax=Bacillus sp. SM2101 TaxID=2805366 RepID=UPI001BDEC5E0|nr:sporulation integral membrane protein YtvI [Bacillus sp. SM2101]